MKNLKVFETNALFEAARAALDLPNVSLVEEDFGVQFLPFIEQEEPEPSYNILDILYSDSNGNLSVSTEVLDTLEFKTPIALCIAGTGFFGENEKARWISLKYMSSTSPETGTVTQSQSQICPGNNGVDISTINNIGTTHNGGTSWGYLTADWITGTTGKIPSLFDENDEWNISVLGTVNSYLVTDIDGKNKTDMILATATAQSDWRSASTITNESGEGYAPAACCCARYHTLGTHAGDWYLGAVGEMSIAIVQKNSINAKLAAIAAVYQNDCINELNGVFPTCDEVGTGQFYLVRSGNGAITANGGKGSTFEVIAMLQY